MEWQCIVVNLSPEGSDHAAFAQAMSTKEFPVPVLYCASVEEGIASLGTLPVAVMVVVAGAWSESLLKLFTSYQRNVGCIGDFQAVVCEDPLPDFMANVFEFGIDQFFSPSTWTDDLEALIQRTKETLSAPDSPESKAINLVRSVRGSDQIAIQAAVASIGEAAEYDFRVAFAKGKAREALGDYQNAAQEFQAARKLNRMFRPSTASLGDALMITGKVDEAISLFNQMEKTNPNNADRKISLAQAYSAKGDFVKAAEYAKAAESLGGSPAKVAEVQAQVALSSGKLQDAVKMMDSLSDAGPMFAAKLNEVGVKLSQAGKAKSALVLYQKAHKIVRNELKYKLSMNAALACHRLGDFELALKFLARCQKEYGSSFPKLEKIRGAVKAAKAQKVGDPALAAKTAAVAPPKKVS